ncbi:hypothetical protein QE152_g38502 [Popillia japonica]|uniref:Uncharacterized protein n=1 Tax=Popillia japonica TaxID=7064 RepID=A0AAW1HXA5_POPJA
MWSKESSCHYGCKITQTFGNSNTSFKHSDNDIEQLSTFYITFEHVFPGSIDVFSAYASNNSKLIQFSSYKSVTKMTRSKSTSESDETLIQKVVEKVLSNKSFLDKLLDTVKETLEAQDKRIGVIENVLDATNKSIKHLQDNIEQQEQYSRINNLRIFGLTEEPGEDIEKTVINFCKDKLNVYINAFDIDHCHRLKHASAYYSQIL